MVDSAYIPETLQKLVQINSVNPSLEETGVGEEEIGRFIAGELKSMGIKTVIDEIAPGRLNVVGILPGTGGGRSLMLNAHMDTVGVAGMENPFSGTISKGKLYGRGSYDMKASIAAILAAAKALAEDKPESLKGDVMLSFVADEEYESLGAQHFVKKYEADAAIVTEPSDLDVCLAHRGFGVFKIVTQGKTAHGGNHRLGVDANMKMGLLLAELNDYASRLMEQKTHPLCGEASAHVPLIEGGNSLFIYSDKCTIHLERRTLPGETRQSVTNELVRIIKKLEDEVPGFRASIECEIWRNPYEIEAEKPVVTHLTTASEKVLGRPPGFTGHTWWEDSAIFAGAGMETVVMGPKGGGIHEKTEWVEIDSVTALAGILYHTAVSYCDV